MTLTRVAVLVIAIAVAGESERKSWPLSQAPDELRSVISRAELVVVAMQGAVLAELNGPARQGASAAFGFCHLDAMALAQRVGKSEGIAAGRTSDRLRNPHNAPRPWAAPLVAAHAGKRAKDVEGFAVDLGDRVGVLRPIVEQPMCAGCHGPRETIAPAVIDAVRQRYPADRAIGFKDGDIRGWFWVEMPKTPSR
ncbi:MAG TPA: DUF3365 domain-containing protein [Vicinamibacterales bacterium]|jgi:hypothetical protein